MILIRHLPDIFKNYYKGLELSNQTKGAKLDVFIICLLPALPAYALVMMWPHFNDFASLFQSLLTALAVLMGFLIAMLVPFLNFIETLQNKTNAQDAAELTPEQRTERQLANARLTQYRIMFSQVSFSTLLTLMSILLLIVGACVLELHLAKYVLDIWGLRIDFAEKRGLSTLVFCIAYFGTINFYTIFRILISAKVIVQPVLNKQNEHS